jgi:hypothetical protein
MVKAREYPFGLSETPMGLVVAWEDISKSTEAVILLVLNRRFIILLLKRPISFV